MDYMGLLAYGSSWNKGVYDYATYSNDGRDDLGSTERERIVGVWNRFSVIATGLAVFSGVFSFGGYLISDDLSTSGVVFVIGSAALAIFSVYRAFGAFFQANVWNDDDATPGSSSSSSSYSSSSTYSSSTSTGSSSLASVMKSSDNPYVSILGSALDLHQTHNRNKREFDQSMQRFQQQSRQMTNELQKTLDESYKQAEINKKLLEESVKKAQQIKNEKLEVLDGLYEECVKFFDSLSSDNNPEFIQKFFDYKTNPYQKFNSAYTMAYLDSTLLTFPFTDLCFKCTSINNLIIKKLTEGGWEDLLKKNQELALKRLEMNNQILEKRPDDGQIHRYIKNDIERRIDEHRIAITKEKAYEKFLVDYTRTFIANFKKKDFRVKYDMSSFDYFSSILNENKTKHLFNLLCMLNPQYDEKALPGVTKEAFEAYLKELSQEVSKEE